MTIYNLKCPRAQRILVIALLGLDIFNQTNIFG